MRSIRTVFLALLLLTPSSLWARTKLQGIVERGGQPVVTNGVTSTTKSVRTFPGATITICTSGVSSACNGGSGNLSTIYSNSTGTPLSNPFHADTAAAWFAFLDDGTYDILFSPSSFAAWTLSAVSVGGSSGAFIVAPPPSGGDDTATVQSLINSTSPLGIDLILQFGVYHTSATLTPLAGRPLHLRGAGHRYNTSTGTVIQATASMTAVLSLSESYSTISGLKLDANRQANYGVLLIGSVGSRFINGAIQNALLDGFHSDGATLNQLNELDQWFSTDNGKTYATAPILSQYPANSVRQSVVAGTAATTAGNGVITISSGPDLTTLGIRTGFAGDLVRVSDGQTLTSLTSVGTTATGTTTTAHGWSSGQLVVIVGASPTAYNGSYLITVTAPPRSPTFSRAAPLPPPARLPPTTQRPPSTARSLPLLRLPSLSTRP